MSTPPDDPGSAWGEPPPPCPHCGSATYLTVYGLPSPSVFETAPPWIRFGGCVIVEPVLDAGCTSCGRAWSTRDQGSDGQDTR